MSSQLQTLTRLQRLQQKVQPSGRMTAAQKTEQRQLLRQFYNGDPSTTWFYSQDDLGFPTAKIPTTIAGETFYCTLALQNVLTAEHWEGKSKPRFFYGPSWPPTSAIEVVGGPGIALTCVNCGKKDKPCTCSYQTWSSEKHNFWIDHTRIKAMGNNAGHHGLFASTDLDPGTILGEYTGELIPDDHTKSDEESAYWAAFPLGPVRPDKGGGQQRCQIDSARKGSVFRFANHSCQPNAQLFVSRVGMTHRVKYVEVITPIEEGEEILIKYANAKTYFPEGEWCWCGEWNCQKPPPEA